MNILLSDRSSLCALSSKWGIFHQFLVSSSQVGDLEKLSITVLYNKLYEVGQWCWVKCPKQNMKDASLHMKDLIGHGYMVSELNAWEDRHCNSLDLICQILY